MANKAKKAGSQTCVKPAPLYAFTRICVCCQKFLYLLGTPMAPRAPYPAYPIKFAIFSWISLLVPFWKFFRSVVAAIACLFIKFEWCIYIHTYIYVCIYLGCPTARPTPSRPSNCCSFDTFINKKCWPWLTNFIAVSCVLFLIAGSANIRHTHKKFSMVSVLWISLFKCTTQVFGNLFDIKKGTRVKKPLDKALLSWKHSCEWFLDYCYLLRKQIIFYDDHSPNLTIH